MAQAKLSKQATKLAKNVTSSADSIGNLAKRIDEGRVRELIRRVSIPIVPDGYPSSSMPERTSGGGQSDPTYGVVIAKEKSRKDPVAAELRRVVRNLEKAESLLRDTVGIFDGIDRKVEEKVERAVSTPCAICLQLPATKSGYCAPDYLDWWRYGQPDRHLFELWRRGEVNSEGTALVEECPPPSPGCTAKSGPYRAKS